METSRRCPVGSHESSTTALYTEIRPLLFRIALRVTGNRADAEDAVQDVFLAVLERADRPAYARAYLLAAVRNRAISSFRDRRQPVQLIESLVSTGPAAEFPPHATIRLAAYAKAAGGDHRLPLIWRGIAADRTYREIAADLGMTVNAIKCLICRSRKRLGQVAADGGATWS